MHRCPKAPEQGRQKETKMEGLSPRTLEQGRNLRETVILYLRLKEHVLLWLLPFTVVYFEVVHRIWRHNQLENKN